MNNLRTYLEIIDPRLLHHISGKPAELIQLLRKKPEKSEKELCTHICKGEKDRKYYLNLKSKTLKLLQGLAFVSVVRGESLVKKKFHLCQKKFLIGQKFLAEKDQTEGIRLIKQAYRLATTYNFVFLACEMANLLYKHYVYYQPQRKKAQAYAEQMRAYLHDYQTERRAEDYYLQYISRKNQDDPALAELDTTLHHIQALRGRSLRYHLYLALLGILRGFILTDYPQVIRTCQRTLDFYHTQKGVFGGHFQYLYSKMGIANMALGHYALADTQLQTAATYAPRKSFNEFLVRLYQTINALHSGQYEQAYALFRDNHRRCKFELIRQQFAIIEAYLCFLAHCGQLQLERTFRLGKYLNENILTYSEKEGDNVTILIAELLVYLIRKRGKFIDRVDAIHTYSYRHLRRPESQRAKRFIKLLCALPKLDFQLEQLQREYRKDIAFIQQTPLRIGRNVAIIEVVPYQDLLELVFQQLHQRPAATAP